MMKITKTAVLAGAFLLATATLAPAAALPPLESLGKKLFFDTNLSNPPGQSCAACHAPQVGFTGPDSAINAAGAVYQGAMPGRFGNRKPPTSAYAGGSPKLYFDKSQGGWIGGMFWDGRATGGTLGDPLTEQAQGPFLNPLEHNMADAKQVCNEVRYSSYATQFISVWGLAFLDCEKEADRNFERIARSIAAYERSAEVNPFSSKFDLFWDKAKRAGKDVTKIRFAAMTRMRGGSSDPYQWQAYRGLG